MKILPLIILAASLAGAEASTISFENFRIEREDVATTFPRWDALRSESLSLNVLGRINSFTVVPFWSDLNNPSQDFLPFEFHFEPAGSTNSFALFKSTDPVTITFAPFWDYSELTLRIWGNFGEAIHFNWHPDAHLLYGLTLESVDYTPSSVPETGSSLTLLVLGLLGCVYARRQFFAAT